MNVRDFFRRAVSSEAQPRPAIAEVAGQRVSASAASFTSLNDPDLLEFMRGGTGTASGEYVTVSKALHNMALLRSVSLISESIGMLPLNLMEAGESKAYAAGHPVQKLLKQKPNTWQTPYEFKSTMQLNALVHGNAYARIVRSRGRPLHLVPLESQRMKPALSADWNMVYTYTRADGGQVVMPAKDVFHLRDLSDDGIEGMSRVRLAKEAIGLALQAESAAARLFRNGVMAGGALSSKSSLTQAQIDNLSASLLQKYSGAENAHKWLILEEGLEAEKWADNASDSQHIENRAHQIEEIARAFGIPRPLLMMDDTSWGSGIEQLGIFFVQYALQHWFTAWEQAVERSLLEDDERDKYHAKFNERALLRGTLKDQADFFAKALGAGGQAPWMSQNEIRDLQDLAKSSEADADKLRNPMTQQPTPEKPNEPAETP